MSTYVRRAHHAGSWYSDDSSTLDQELSQYLQSAAQEQPIADSAPPLRAVISPHAGFSYSGPTAAYSFHPLSVELSRSNSPVRTLLVLHPSHHHYLDGCAVSGASALETPLGNLQVDDSLRREILGLSAKFSTMRQGVDEREHSGEMQYPYLAKAIKAQSHSLFQVLPVMCGNLSPKQEAEFGSLLAPIVARPSVVCVISSDFCHWGQRFQYQPTGNSSSEQIYEFIQSLDRQGMQQIEWQEPGAFAKYLKDTRNTICGRHAIGVWLNAVHANKNQEQESLDISFVKYAQSSSVRSMRDSSVSYASATARKKIA